MTGQPTPTYAPPSETSVFNKDSLKETKGY